jgi:hypothetical protein
MASIHSDSTAVNELYTLFNKKPIQQTWLPPLRPISSVLAQIRLQTGLHMTIPLRKALEHPAKKLLLVLKPRGQVVHIGIRRLVFEPDLGVGAAVAHTSPTIDQGWQEGTTHRITCSILQQ